MKKEVLVGVIVVVVVVILTSLLFLGGDKISIDPEKQEYAEFNAKVACGIFEVTSLEDLSAMVKKIQDTMEDYGYTEEDVTNLRDKYQKDEEFVEILKEELNKECPERVDEFNLDEYFNSLSV